MTKLEDILSNYYNGVDKKILRICENCNDEVFTTKELAKICGCGTMKTAEASLHLYRTGKLNRVKIKNITYSGSFDAISNLEKLLAGTRIGSKMGIKSNSDDENRFKVKVIK